MLDGSALSKSHNRPSEQTPAGRTVLSAPTWQAVLIVLGIALVTFVLYLYVLPNSQIDAAKVRIAELQAQKAMLERENAALLQEIARESNLKTLEIRAKALGMGPTKHAIYLRLPESSRAPATQPAIRQVDPAAEYGDLSPRQLPAMLAGWLQRDRLQDWLRDLRWNVSQAVDNVLERFQSN
jgi:hypothetical protein